MSRSKYAVGDAWEAMSPRGSRGMVTLSRILADGSEFWEYSWCFSDGSSSERDWAPSRRKAIELCKVLFGGERVRFRRVKRTPPCGK